MCLLQNRPNRTPNRELQVVKHRVGLDDDDDRATCWKQTAELRPNHLYLPWKGDEQLTEPLHGPDPPNPAVLFAFMRLLLGLVRNILTLTVAEPPHRCLFLLCFG